ASVYYRCMISTEDAFPSHIKEMEFAQRAWKEACASIKAAVPPHPDALTVIMRRASQMRGEVKSKIRLLVLSSYDFNPSQTSTGREYNLKRVATLKEDLNFTYKGNVLERKGLYQNPILQKAINVIWFANRIDEGVLYSKFFRPIPLPTIALVLTAIECGINEWRTGSREDIDFKLSDYKNTYEDHVVMLNIFKDETQNIGIVPKIQNKLYQNAQ
ncbi:hypothetical protein BC826DRAFT_917178, partial [Russula brevipes]